ncbi:MAG: ribose 5-phosphate isomerase B [Candidatus Nucleicultricaceae bacterium]
MRDHNPTNIVIASDHAGFALKAILIQKMTELSLVYEDLGTYSTDSVDYPDYAHMVVKRILEGTASFGVLICGTGIGMSIAANRYPGIRAAVCLDGTPSATLARAHNNANILCLGARLMTEVQALDAFTAFLETPFEGGRHQRRIEKCDTPYPL